MCLQCLTINKDQQLHDSTENKNENKNKDVSEEYEYVPPYLRPG